jgi:hypothetical protein
MSSSTTRLSPGELTGGPEGEGCRFQRGGPGSNPGVLHHRAGRCSPVIGSSSSTLDARVRPGNLTCSGGPRGLPHPRPLRGANIGFADIISCEERGEGWG